MTPPVMPLVARVAEVLLQTYGPAAAELGSPLWLEVRSPTAESFEARVTPFGPAGFTGYTAPPEVWAVAVVGTGRLRPLDPGVELPASLLSGLGGGARLCCVVTREAEVGWQMILADGHVLDAGPEEGAVLDALKRALRLPTPPAPVEGAAVATLCEWTTAMAEAGPAAPERAKGRRCGLSWEEALQLHPSVAALPVPVSADAAQDVIAHQAGAMDWDRLRLEFAALPAGRRRPAPDEAGWMDAGMFARRLLEELPTLEELIAEARSWLTPAAGRRLAHFARALAAAGPSGWS